MSPEQQERAHALARGIAGMTEDAGVRLLALELVGLLGTPKTPTIHMDRCHSPVAAAPVSEHPEAARSRRRRASVRQAAEHDPRQLELAPVATGRDRSVTATPPLSQDPDPPPTLNKIRKGSPARTVAYDPDRPPVWLLAMAPEIRTDLAEWDLRDMWRSFCDVIAKRGFGHKDESDLRAHLKNWLRIEDREKRQASRQAYVAASDDDAGRNTTSRDVTPRHGIAAEAEPSSAVEPLEHPDDIVYTPKPAELAKARLRALPPAMLAAAMRTVPADFEADFTELFPFQPPEPRSMSA